MSFSYTLLNGEQGLFKPISLTPMQKMTLRFVVIGLIYYGFAVVEGMIMRMYAVKPIEMVTTDQYFAILTAHPLVGIFGSTYSIVFGAFLFLVPFLMKKPLWSIKLANWTCGLVAIGTFVLWFSGFLTHYAPLYIMLAVTGDFSPIQSWSGGYLLLLVLHW
jgi:cytochrome c oxidase subunit 1